MKTMPPTHKLFDIQPTGSQGFALVEMAVASSILLLMVFAIFEGGIMIYDKGLVSSASRDAARALIVLRSPALKPEQYQPEAQNIVITNYASSFIGFDNSAHPPLPSIDVVPGVDSIGKKQTVTVTYPYQGLILPALINLIDPQKTMDMNVPISSSTSMYME